jgi:hypothetical protein
MTIESDLVASVSRLTEATKVRFDVMFAIFNHHDEIFRRQSAIIDLLVQKGFAGADVTEAQINAAIEALGAQVNAYDEYKRRVIQELSSRGDKS